MIHGRQANGTSFSMSPPASGGEGRGVLTKEPPSWSSALWQRAPRKTLSWFSVAYDREQDTRSCLSVKTTSALSARLWVCKWEIVISFLCFFLIVVFIISLAILEVKFEGWMQWRTFEVFFCGFDSVCEERILVANWALLCASGVCFFTTSLMKATTKYVCASNVSSYSDRDWWRFLDWGDRRQSSVNFGRDGFVYNTLSQTQLTTAAN